MKDYFFSIDKSNILWYTIINKNKLFKGEGLCLFMIRIQLKIHAVYFG